MCTLLCRQKCTVRCVSPPQCIKPIYNNCLSKTYLKKYKRKEISYSAREAAKYSPEINRKSTGNEDHVT